MEVTRGCQIIEVEILKAQLGDRTGIGEDVALDSMRQNEGYAGLCAMHHAGKVHTARAQAFHRQLSEGIFAGLGDEPHAAAKSSQVMRQDVRDSFGELAM